MKRFLKYTLLIILIVGFVACIATWKIASDWLAAPLASLPESGMEYQLESGGSLGYLVRDLTSRNVLKYPKVLLLYARITKKTLVKAGDYQIKAGISPIQLLEVFNKGAVISYSVTLIEGWTFQQAVLALSEKKHLKSFLAGRTSSEQLALLGLPIQHTEGWFFPDTYQYINGASDVDILRRAYQKMKKTIDALWVNRAQNLPYKTPYEALIMASIVERETGAAWEREKIAGVFVKRLGIGMRLQTDPAVIYGMGANYKGNLTRKDLKKRTAYNTYVIKGLPPTPIALPGHDSIYASLHPTLENALYFVAKGDGTHVFSGSIEAHNRAVRQYQLKRRKDYRSSLKTAPKS